MRLSHICGAMPCFITALFNNMRTLKFKAQPTNAFFATVNYEMFGGSSQLPTMLIVEYSSDNSFLAFFLHRTTLMSLLNDRFFGNFNLALNLSFCKGYSFCIIANFSMQFSKSSHFANVSRFCKAFFQRKTILMWLWWFLACFWHFFSLKLSIFQRLWP